MGTHHVGAHRAVYVPEADDHRERDAALVAALDVVRHPRDRVRDVRVDAAGGEIHPEIREPGTPRGDEDDVPREADAGADPA